jgi:hypothetical protein
VQRIKIAALAVSREKTVRGALLFGIGFTSSLPQHEVFKEKNKHKKVKIYEASRSATPL